MRDMEDRMGRDGASYQDTIARLEADIAKMKVTILEALTLAKTSPKFGNWKVGRTPSCSLATLLVVWHYSAMLTTTHAYDFVLNSVQGLQMENPLGKIPSHLSFTACFQ